MTNPILVYTEQQPSGFVVGATYPSGSWNNLIFNTEVEDISALGQLDDPSNTVMLQPGVYDAMATVLGRSTLSGRVGTRLRDTTHNVTLLNGQWISPAQDLQLVTLPCYGRFSISEASAIAFQVFVDAGTFYSETHPNLAAGTGEPNVGTKITFERVGDAAPPGSPPPPPPPGTYSDDRCVGGTASASSILGAGFEASKGFDDNKNTRWVSSGTGPGWLEYQFAASIVPVRIALQIGESGLVSLSSAVKDFTIEGFNGSTWDVLKTVSGELAWNYNERRTYDFTNTVSYSRVRINISVVQAGQIEREIDEMEVMELL